ncbi:MAG: carboxypeptidase M32, partial [Alphaproteobacteria bacterium]
MQAYRELEERFARIATLTEMGEILHWDMSTKMPPGGAAGRADHLALQEVLSHQMITDPALADLLPAAAEEPLDDWQRANLAEMRRRWLHATA